MPGDEVTVTTRRAAVPWLPILWFTSLLVLSYWPVLVKMVRQWSEDEDMGHAFFVPLVAGYIAWQRREELFGSPAQPCWLGALLLACAAVQCFIGALGAELFLQRSSIVISVVGAVLLAGGFRIAKMLALALFMLLFMIPLPSIIYGQITFPLQLLASRVAEASLGLLGIPVLREGNVLELANQKLSVVEACSGIRSLLSLSFLALVYAYFFDRRAWMRPVLLVATIPIAITANATRVTVTGILSQYDSELAKGFYHSAQGWIIFMTALACLVITHRVIDVATRMKRRA